MMLTLFVSSDSTGELGVHEKIETEKELGKKGK